MTWQRRRTDRKRRRFCIELLEDRRVLDGTISQLGYFDTWAGGVIRSTDVAGIGYHPSGQLYLADSEINELALFNGDNIFATSLNGDFVHREIASGNSEPTGITYNEFDGYFYVTNDTENRAVTRYGSSLNDPLYEFEPKDDVSSATDPEGITSNPANGYLYVADGHDGGTQILTYRLDLSNSDAQGRDVNFEGVFYVGNRMDDVEGIAFHETSGHLFLMDSGQKAIFEYTTTGIFVEKYDISGFSPKPKTPQGLTFGPTSSTSDHPDNLSLYIADGGIDNGADGGVYEATIGSGGSSPATSSITFRALADVPYTQAQYADLQADLANVGQNDEFFIHLGDIQAEGACPASNYSDISNTLSMSSIPVFIVPGDNEYNDCSDPNQAWNHWSTNLLRLEDKWSHDFDAVRQLVRPENFSFVRDKVLFIGINLVGGKVHDDAEWSQRMSDNAVWVNKQFEDLGDDVNSAVIFAHAFSDPSRGDRQQFGEDFVTAAQGFGKPILYLMGDDHAWTLDQPFTAAPNVTRVTVDQGTPSVRVTITDDPVNPYSFTYPGSGTNFPPTLAAIGNQTVKEGDLLTFTASATDPNEPDDNLYFSLGVGAPVGATIHPITGQFNWTPPLGSSGVYGINVRVSDDAEESLTDGETILVTVTEINRPPLLTTIGNQSVDEGSALAFTAVATDPNTPADILTFSLGPGAPTGATIHPSTGEFHWAPPVGTTPGIRAVTVRVNDDGTPILWDSETIEITLNDVNLPPVLSAIGDHEVEEGSELTFTASAVDPDNPADNLVFSLADGAPIGASIHPTTGQFTWTPILGTAPGPYPLTVVVTDDGTPNQATSETISILVREANRPPELATIGDMSVDEGSELTFTASASDPNASDSLIFSLDATAPIDATIHRDTGVFSWTPPGGTSPGTHLVTVRVSDDREPSLEDFETITITVNDVNLSPTLADIPDQSASEFALLTFTALATDRDIPSDGLSYSLDAGAPSGATIDPDTGVFTWTPDESHGPGVYSVTVRVTDDGAPALDDSKTVSINVAEVNQPPVLAAIDDMDVEEGNLLSFVVQATDDDTPANTLTYSLGADPPVGASIDPTTGVFSWTPDEAAGPGNYAIAVQVSDDGTPSRNDVTTFTVTVSETNQAPLLTPIGDKSVDEGSLLTFAVAATDPDLPANNFSYTLDPGAPFGAAIDPNTGQFSWTPPAGTSPGIYAVTVRVSDDGVPSLDDSETITITVNDVNLPPVLAAIGGQEIGEGNQLTFTVAATDADLPADNLIFSLDAGAPAGLAIDRLTGVVTWTPDEVDGPAVYSVTVRVTDDGTPSRDDFETIDITVGEINQRPSLAPIGDMSVDEASLLTFTASVNDGDLPANNFTFSLDSGAPPDAIIDPNTGQFSWTPPGGTSPGTHSVTVRVTDDGTPTLDAFETITITVNDINLAPRLTEVNTQNVQEGNLLTLTAAATDLDLPADNLTYSLDSGAPAAATINPVTGVFRWTPGELAGPGEYSVTVRVTDDGTPNQEDFQTILISVDEVNEPPVLTAISNQSIDEGSLLTFQASASDSDVPENNLTYSLDPGAPAGATIHPITGEFRWTPTEADGPAVYSISIRVTDDGIANLDDVQSFDIIVGEVNEAPQLVAIGDQSVDEGRQLEFTAFVTDADLPANKMTFSLDAGAPDGATIDAGTGEFRWTPNESHGPGVYPVTVRITDDGTPNLGDFETINITVGEVNQPPVLAAIGGQSVNEGNLLTFTASATDPDSPANSFTFSLDPGAPPGATIDAVTGEFRWIPSEAEGPAVYSVTIRVTDDGSPSLDGFESFDIMVGEINEAPILAPIGSQSVDEGSLLTFTALVFDPDSPANNLTYSLDPGAPQGASIDPNTGQFNWTPPGGSSPGSYTVTVRVVDDGVPRLEDFETITIGVRDVNLPPVLAPIGAQTVDERSLLSFTAQATDADLPADNLTFSLDSGAPDGATLDSTTGEFNWNPGELEVPVTHSVTIRVTDDGIPRQVDFETFTIEVLQVNRAPVLAAIGDKRIDEAGLLTFTASAFDDNLPINNLFFSLDPGAPQGATIDPTTGQFRWEPPGGLSVGDHIVTVRVTDDGEPNLDDSETITVTVDDVNLPPVLDEIGGQSVQEGSPLTFVASTTDLDLPANNLTFSLDVGAPSGATIDAETGAFSWTPGESHGNGVFSVTLWVMDDGTPQLSDSQTVNITVLEVNQAPVLRAIGDKRINEGRRLTFTAIASDADVPNNQLTFSLGPGAPDGATIDPDTGQFNWTPDETTPSGEYSVTIGVIDDGVPNREDFEIITITVDDENSSPVLAAIGDQSVDEGNLLTFTASATDSDLPVDNLTYSLDSGAPAGALIDPNTGVFRWRPGEAQGPAVYSVNVRVTDDGTPDMSDFEMIEITVGEVNQTPVLSSIPNQLIVEDSLMTFTALASDFDLPSNNLTFSLGSNAPDGATIHPTTGQFRWIPPDGASGTSQGVTVRVTDNGVPNRTASVFVVFRSDLSPEINLVGNDRTITHGDDSPGLSDHTDFGAGEMGVEVVTRTYRIENTGTETLVLTGSPPIEIVGVNAADFQVTLQPPTSIEVGESVEFTIEFDPSEEDLRTAVVSIGNNDGNENPYEFTIQGTGTQEPLDVNRDGTVTVLDALAIINEIDRTMSGEENDKVDNGDYNYDANRDGTISTRDALMVINFISAMTAEGELKAANLMPRQQAIDSDSSRLDDDLISMLADDNIAAGGV